MILSILSKKYKNMKDEIFFSKIKLSMYNGTTVCFVKKSITTIEKKIGIIS